MADENGAKLLLTGPSLPDGNVHESAKPYLIELGRLLFARNDYMENWQNYIAP
jgi:hypothetical protein